MLIKHVVIGFLVLAVLLSCSVGRDYETPEMLQQDYGSFKAYPDDRFRSADPIKNWWEALEDKQLSFLIQEALEHNHDIRVAIANVERARAIASEAEFDRFPTVKADAASKWHYLTNEGITGPVADRTVETYEAGFDALWEVDLFGRVRENIASSEASLMARIADLQSAYVTVAAEVARVYIELRGAQYRLDVGRRNAENQRETYTLTTKLTDRGNGTELDVARAKTQLELTEASLKPLEAEINAAMNRLGVLTGKAPHSLYAALTERRPLPSIPESVAVGNPVDLIRRRPDIRSAEQELAASVADYNVNVAELYPVITLQGSIGYLATSFAAIGTGGAFNYIYGPNLNWSIFDYGHVRARIGASDALAKARLAEFEKTLLMALEEIDKAMVNFSQEERRRARLFEAAQASDKAAKIAKRRFEAGVDSFLDMLDSERTLLEAEDLLAISEINTALNLVAIYKALGGGWEFKFGKEKGAKEEGA